MLVSNVARWDTLKGSAPKDNVQKAQGVDSALDIQGYAQDVGREVIGLMNAAL